MTLFFEFLQVAVGNRKSLSVSVTDADWHRLFEFCKRQALIGVGFSAVEKLHAMGVVCPAALRMQWMALALQIEKRNEVLNRQCAELTRRYEHDGLSTCILKGQGNYLNYPEGLRTRRMPGDIDVWATPIKDERLRGDDFVHTENTEGHGCPQADEMGKQQLVENNKNPQMSQMDTDGCPQADGGVAIAVQTGKEDLEYVEYHGLKAVIEYVRMQHRLEGNIEKPVIRYHHIESPKMEGTEVEVHFRPCYAHSPLRNRRMQRWFNDHADVCMKNKTHMGFAVPTASVNVVYQMCHLFSHYFDEGLGLRQLMDYYFALRVWHNDVMECKDLQTQGMWSEGLGTPVMSKEEVMSVLRSFGMTKFAGAVMYVLHKVFAIPTRQMINDERLLINDFVHMENADGNGGPQADEVGEQQLSKIRQQLKEKFVCEPWLLCEPNEREGRKLLEEIMKGDNFGQFDTRDAELKKGGMMKHGLWKLKRVMRLVRSYPEEALWEPVFRVYHLGWRLIH